MTLYRTIRRPFLPAGEATLRYALKIRGLRNEFMDGILAHARPAGTDNPRPKHGSLS